MQHRKSHLSSLRTLLKPVSFWILSAIAAIPTVSFAQGGEQTDNIIVIEPLFEYISAPEELEGLQAKSDYLMVHFWDPMNFKNKAAVDQNALNDAFSVFTTPMRWATKDVALAQVDELIKKLQKNPTLLYQFTRAAEEILYGPRATVYIDEIYLKFLEAIVKNKKIDPTRKTRYADQYKRLSNTRVGERAPEFEFIRAEGTPGRYFPMSTFTIIEFGHPDCDDCNLARLKMETNVALSNLIDNGLVNILFIIPDNGDEWKALTIDYPKKWTVAAAPDVEDIYDIRDTPCFYTIGSDGKILSKNISVVQAIDEALSSTSK